MSKPANLQALLASAVVEKDVENAYRSAIVNAHPTSVVSSPHGCDGLIAWGDVRLLLECKLDVDLKDRAVVCRVLGQALAYVRKFVDAGEPVPNVIILADRNECMVLPLAVLDGFLALDIDWSIAPSTGSPELTAALASGLVLAPHVFDVTARFKLASVLDVAEALAQGREHLTRATLSNVGEIFRHWREHVFTGKLGHVDQVDVFLRCLFDPCDVYLHPNKRNTLIVPGYAAGVQVHADRYRAFFDRFAQGYRPSEVEAFYASKDRLIDDDARRRQGAFFTPRIWVDEAHRTIEGVLGPTWREECIVWDPACGTGNLTRDYAFPDLILSTAERSDVTTIEAQGYNPGASVFQYDFLNPNAPSPFFDGKRSTIPPHVDAQLRAAAKAGKRLVFLMNPPYGTANNNAKDGTSKAGIADTRVGAAMKMDKCGACSAQLYAQFMYQAAELVTAFGFSSSTVALYSKPTFMASGTYKSFRERWARHYGFSGGFLFQASHFADVSAAWGIAFTVWSSDQFPCEPWLWLTDCSAFTVTKADRKLFYISDGADAAMWVRTSGVSGDAPKISSGLQVKEKGVGRLFQGSLLSFGSNANNCQDNATLVYFLSAADTRSGIPVLPINFRRCMALFAARKLVLGTWINDKDEYLAPDETAPGYAQWVDDAHVYALLHPSNNCTAMRGVPYKGRDWTISNQLFWLSRAEALAALDTSDTLALYRDCKATPAGYIVPKPDDAPREPWEVAGDPYLAHVLPSLDLSPEARDVLDRLRALWLASLHAREAFASGRPELHLLAWDAGVYQLKHLWREHFTVEWEELRAAHRKLADRLRPGVYDFGFLLR